MTQVICPISNCINNIGTSIGGVCRLEKINLDFRLKNNTQIGCQEYKRRNNDHLIIKFSYQEKG